MNHRGLVSVSTLIAVVFVATLPGAGQAPPAAAKTAGAPTKPYAARTPDGQPDLQGFWTNSTYTALERPKGVTKEFFTREEALANAKRAAAAESAQTTPGTVEDVHYDFSQFALDRNQSPLAETLRTSLIVDPPEGRLPPLTAEGVKRAAEVAEVAKRVGRWDSAQSNQLDDRCLIMAGAGPPLLPAGYNANYQIVQAPGYVMILVEMIHDVRIIPLDGRAPLAQNISQWMGDSRGRWEGDTLVVETTNFNGKNPLRGSSEKLRVTERFTRVDAGNILYRFTVDDKGTWTKPWSAELPMTKAQGPLFEHACHEGNYGLLNTLVGARGEEKRAAAKKK